MAELDALQLAKEARTFELNEGGYATDLDSEEMAAIIAALEDRDWLQAAVKNWHRPIAPSGNPCVCASCEALAALEGRDG